MPKATKKKAEKVADFKVDPILGVTPLTHTESKAQARQGQEGGLERD
jgi:hypothetical protein